MNYQLKAEKVAKAIRKNGKPITLTIKTAANHDPATGKTTPTTVPDPGYCIEDKATTKWNEDGTVLNSAKKLLCVDLDDPKPDELVTVDGTSFKIVHVNPIRPGDVVLLYEVYVK